MAPKVTEEHVEARWRQIIDAAGLVGIHKTAGEVSAELDPEYVTRVAFALVTGGEVQFVLDPDFDMGRYRDAVSALIRADWWDPTADAAAGQIDGQEGSAPNA